MADNVPITAGSGTTIATDDVTDAGGAHYQRIKLTDGTANSTTVVAAGNGVAANALRVTLASDGTGVVGLSTGSNAIGKLAANTGVDIGDVDVTSVVPGTGATNLGKAEDAGHTTGDVGVMALGVRNDADAAISGTDLDYTPISTTAEGNVNVEARRDLVRVSIQHAGTLTTAATPYAAGDQLGGLWTITGAARKSGGGGVITGVVVVSAADTIGAMDIVFFDSSVTLAANDAAFDISDADALKVVALVQLAGAYDLGQNRIAQAYNLAVPYVLSGSTSLYAALITRYAIPATPFAANTNLQLIVYLERN